VKQQQQQQQHISEEEEKVYRNSCPMKSYKNVAAGAEKQPAAANGHAALLRLVTFAYVILVPNAIIARRPAALLP
jgi:hypothetical protein